MPTRKVLQSFRHCSVSSSFSNPFNKQIVERLLGSGSQKLEVLDETIFRMLREKITK